MQPKIDLEYFQCFRHAGTVTQSARGILMEVEDELLRVDVLRDDVVRLKISRGRVFDETPSFAVCADLESGSPRFSVHEDGTRVELKTSALSVCIRKAPFSIDARRSDGSVIFESYEDPEGNHWAYSTINDEFIIRRKCSREDAFYGLGEKTGHLNRRGRDFTMQNLDVFDARTNAEFLEKTGPRNDCMSTEFDPYYVTIPFFYHLPHATSDMAGFFIDNGYRAHFEFSRRDEYRIHFRGGQYTEYIFAGPQMREVLGAYTWLTGRMQPPPIWALGYHQCRWFNYTRETLERLAATQRESQIPCDVLWLDIDYMDGYRVFTWNEKAFPAVKEMLDGLRAKGFRLITIIDPGVKYDPGYSVFDQAVERDVLCKTEGGAIYQGQVWPGKTAFPDFVTEEARQWWGELNALHVQSGVAGIWNDMNEPATGAIPPDAMRFGHGQYSHERYHNQYALLMAMGTTEGLLKAMPNQRTFVLSRAGFSGIQRYSANWLGDNCSRWEHLWMSLPMALGFGVSGQPFIGADIGGFGENTNAELLVRWMQCGALVPFCRNHNEKTCREQYPWAFGEAVEDLCRRSIQLRYRLMPYLYSQFMQAAETGAPVQIPLVFEFQDDAVVRDIDDQYLLGEHLLVAPIYTQGATARQVYLPAGTWYQWHTGEKLAGKRFIVAAAPMDYIPLYARGGSVIPMWPQAPDSTMGYHPEMIELHVFIPDEDGEFQSLLHEDDGDTFAFREGAFYRTVFVMRKAGAQITLDATVSGDGYPEFARREYRVVFHGGIRGLVRVNEATVSMEEHTILLKNTATRFQIEVEAETTSLIYTVSS
jgi:alpha-glucosidase